MEPQSLGDLPGNDQARLDEQRRRLDQLLGDENRRRREALLSWVQRRAGLGDASDPAPHITFLEDTDGELIPVEAGELLAAPPPPERDEELTELLGGFGFRMRESDLVGDVRRFSADRDDVDIAAAIDASREAGFDVTPVQITPLNWRLKGKQGPEQTDRDLGQRPAEGDGVGPIVVAIDTGLASETDRSRDDGWLEGVTGECDPLDLMPPHCYLDLGAGHGTFVAGLVRLVAPNADVHVLRALKWDGYSTSRIVAHKIVQAADHIVARGGRGAINLSLGDRTFLNLEPVDIRAALAYVATLDAEIAVVGSAGNSGDRSVYWPAASDGVIAVAGLRRDLSPAGWSTRGDWVAFSTVSEGLSSTFVIGSEVQGSDSADDPYDDDPETWLPFNPNALWLGTSFAAPQVAAWIARELVENPASTVQSAAIALRQTPGAQDLRGAGFGWGVRIL